MRPSATREPNPLRVLVVEGGRAEEAKAFGVLESAGFAAVLVTGLAEGVRALGAQSFDAIVLDLDLPDANDLDAVLFLREQAPKVPIVVQANADDEALAIRALHHGAHDYLTKRRIDPPRQLVRTVRFAVERARTLAELEQMTQTLQSKNDELARLNAEKDRFLGIAAHDLRNPLGIVLGYADLLAGDAGGLAKDQQQIVATIHSSAEYMLGLVDDLLDFSAFQDHGIRLHYQLTDIAALVRETVAMHRHLAAKKEVAIDLGQLAELPPIPVDARRIRQVLENLLSNAVKFSHRGSRITVSLSAGESDVAFEVADRGVGIAREEIGKLFRPFSKTSARGTQGERSTGLGLAIANNIVQAHGGAILVESEVGHGSTFRVMIPRAPRD